MRWLVIAASLVPLASLAIRAASHRLGANPIETITHETGDFALRFLLAGLAVTPLRRATGWSALAPYRRTFGLLAFSYASLHLATWLFLDLGPDLGAIADDVRKRPYVTVGWSAFLCLLPLAITSTRGWQRRLGARWVALHRLAYVAAGLAVVHFTWLVKADVRAPLVYGALLCALLLARRSFRSR
ncbi:MAG TPA: protein-methionine-sulfoxide reductase heme-binding subunit MsrQ [Myxococcota bacterium]|nr:protein-methionine-sulfoxide reductase heme-binding subunit MsrQ [Myxococcota bacterium]